MGNVNASQETLQAFEVLKQFMLQTFPDAKIAGGGKEIIKRCHYCGDSKDTSSRHLYIGINDAGVIVYNCFKCNTKGVVNSKFFRDMNVYDSDLINLINKANSNSFKSIPTSGEVKFRKHYYATPRVPKLDSLGTDKKINYINNRLGLHLTKEDLPRFKIITDIKSYLEMNNIGYYSRSPQIMEELNIGFLGFLSVDNSHIVMRRLVPKEKVHPNIAERYVNYNIFPNYSGGTAYYVIPGNINVLRPCKIYLAEGPFDILSIYNNVVLDHTNTLFAACCGKNYWSLIQYILLNIGVPYYGLDIEIYSDNDLAAKEINSIKYFLHNAVGIKGNIHFNLYSGEKDFGVPANRIIDGLSNL